MPGFFVSNTKTIPVVRNYEDSICAHGTMSCGEWNIAWNTLNKYMDDKLFYQNERLVILLDGVILNKKELMQAQEQTDWTAAVCQMIDADPVWFRALRGVFAGAVLDKQSNTWCCFTDQCGAHLLMTYVQGKTFAFGTQTNYFSDWMRENDIERVIDPDWKRDILSYSYMRDSHTIFSEVTRVYPGCYYVYDIEQCAGQEHCYYRATKKKQSNLTKEEAIAQLDTTFHNAIRRIVDKDREYGYRTIVDVSGGLDSRMNAVVAAQEAGENVTSLTFAQSGSDDQKIAQRVAGTLGLEHIYYPMDGGDFLAEIDDLIFMNGGFNDYFGITAGKRLLSRLDKNTFGAEIWGLLGDIYEGGMVENSSPNLRWDVARFCRTQRYFDPEPPRSTHEFEDNELLWFYVRGMLAGMNTGFSRQNYIEPMTPYGDVEFMDICFSLSDQQRFHEHIYREWMMERYPEMAKIPYSATGTRVLPGEWDIWSVRFRRYWRKLQMKLRGPQGKWSMNPIDMWYKENDRLHSRVEEYYNTHKYLLDMDQDFGEKVRTLFEQGTTFEKLVAVSVLSALKQYIA